MFRFVVLRFLLLLLLVVTAIFVIRNIQPVGLSEPSRQFMSMDGCVVSEEAAKVHAGERSFENAYIQFINDDDTVQVQTVETKFAMLFKLKPNEIECFKEGWIVPVTIDTCVKDSDSECNFKLPHVVYVRTKLVNVVAWKYSKPAI